VLANLDLSAERARYQLVLAGQPASFALLIDVHASVPWSDWSMPVQTSPVRVTLEHAGQTFVVQPGRMDEAGWRFEFHKHLASASQPFDVVAIRQVLWVELPWALMALWVAGVAGAVAAWSAWQGQRSARRRAEELLRVGQVARLNTLGELAAGMAHELNQPLTAILANTQAAKRLLHDQPPELPIALKAMDQAVAQARRAAEVLARLRRSVEQPGTSQPGESVDLERVVRSALHLLEPESRRRTVAVTMRVEQGATVLAERVALEQIVHNLLTNALQALDGVPEHERHLTIGIAVEQGTGVLRVADSGPGIAADVLPRVFEPFFTTREGGLGLGLSLCETLATGMGGQLRAQANTPRGALFTLILPLADSLAPAP
jgi:signal transduction histidine kinase